MRYIMSVKTDDGQNFTGHDRNRRADTMKKKNVLDQITFDYLNGYITLDNAVCALWSLGIIKHNSKAEALKVMGF